MPASTPHPKPAPKVEDSQVPPPPKTGDHQEWRIDEAEDESFPASDPNAETQPHPTRK
jgi:hypothetical protein